MIGAWLAFGGAVIAFVGGTLDATLDNRRAWRAAAMWAIAVTALAVWWIAAPVGQFAPDVEAEARAGDRSVHATVVFAGEQAGREVRRVSLRERVPQGGFMLGLVAVLALGGALWLSRRPMGRGADAAAGFVPAIAAGGTAAFLSTMASPASGADAVRRRLALLGGDLLGGPTHFSIPSGAWSYGVAGATALAVVAVFALSIASTVQIRGRLTACGPLLRLGAALAAVGPLERMIAVGGLGWRPVEGAVWAAALLLGGAWLDDASPKRRALLAGTGVALAACAVALV